MCTASRWHTLPGIWSLTLMVRFLHLLPFFPSFLPQVLPKPGQLIVQPQATVAPPPPSIPSERSNVEVSSGAGELSDSVSVGEVAVSSIRKKKLKVETELT